MSEVLEYKQTSIDINNSETESGTNKKLSDGVPIQIARRMLMKKLRLT